MSLKLKKNNVEQTINLKEVFDFDFSGKENLKQLIGQAIIDHIVERTKDGLGVSLKDDGSGRTVKLKSPYSKTYAKSLEFKAAGKSKNNVNMTLSGQMLSTLDVKKIDGNKITIGWEDAEENAKAFNHVTGDTVPKRPFFGVSNKELREIKKEFMPEIEEALKIKQDEGKEAFNKFVIGLIKETGGATEG